MPAEFVSRAADWAANQPTAYAEMLAIAEGLQTEGAYSDGGQDANPVSPPGHSLRRLLDFISISQPFGNGEQFAAAQGLMAQALGVPVRVVMGFVNEDGGDEVTFHGEDIEAWIEVPVDGYGWVAIDGTPPEDQLPEPLKQPRSKTEDPEPQPPPPTTVPPPTSIPDDLDPEEPEEDDEEGPAGRRPGLARRPRRRGRPSRSSSSASPPPASWRSSDAGGSGAAPAAPPRSGWPAPSTSSST